MRAITVDHRARVAQRIARPRLALIAVPLAMVAALLTSPVVVLPLAVLAWWWAPVGLGWWLNAMGRGILGYEWALLGISALQTWPDSRLEVGYCWAGSALLLSVAASAMRGRR